MLMGTQISELSISRFSTFIIKGLLLCTYNRETKNSGRTDRIAIETDDQLALELPDIVNGKDRRQSKQTCVQLSPLLIKLY